MKKNDVKVGGMYAMKVGAEVVSVRITDEKWKGDALDGWVGVNLKTNRSVRIKTAQKLRAQVGPETADVPAGDAPAPDAPTATPGDAAPQTPTSGTTKKGRKHKSGITVVGDEPGEGQAEAPADAPPATAKKAKAPKAPKEPKVKKLSALDAAAQVLAAAGKPMNAKEMIAEMAAQNLWTSPGGKTPEATLYAAIIREIGAKGTEARFKKTERGMFEAAGKGARPCPGTRATWSTPRTPARCADSATRTNWSGAMMSEPSAVLRERVRPPDSDAWPVRLPPVSHPVHAGCFSVVAEDSATFHERRDLSCCAISAPPGATNAPAGINS